MNDLDSYIEEEVLDELREIEEEEIMAMELDGIESEDEKWAVKKIVPMYISEFAPNV